MFGLIAGLAGGLLNARSDRKAQSRQNKYDDPVQIRARAEKAGFNPLTYLSSGAAQMRAVSGSHAFGNAVANAGLLIDERKAEKERLDVEKTKLEQDRQRLDKMLERQTIRPKVGGIYSGNQMTPRPATAPVVGAGAKTAAAATVFQPETPYGPRITPVLSDPTKVMRDDGMTSGNPDAPAEFEADAWTWAREGTFFQNAGEIWDRNIGKRKRLAPKTAAAVKRKAEKLAGPFKDERKKGAKPPKINFPNYLPSISD